MGPADATDVTDAGAVALNRDYLLCRSSTLAVNPTTPTRDCIHREKIRADVLPKTVQRCSAKRSA
jgi:hypothetical protein